MLRKTAEKYSFKHYPCFCIYNTDEGSVESHRIKIKSAKSVISRVHIDREAENSKMLDNFIELLEEQYEIGVNFKENLMLFCKANKIDKKVMDILSEIMQEGN